ncbi:MAG: glycoside hydrolase family 76 protein [Bacteroidota bacterium]|nr:glycoside hydrolase family 76 protein [Bacteroidota bacterium]
MKRFFIICIVYITLTSSCSDNYNDVIHSDGGYTIDWSAAADSSTTSLINNFWNPTAHYFNAATSGSDFEYWPQAHGLDVLTDAYLRTNDAKYKTYFDQWYTGVQAGNGGSFFNVYYDDMEWNALALLRTYAVTKDDKFKTAAQTVWTDIQTGWNTNGGGGVSWKKDQPWSKNACSNGPACILAARLFQLFGDTADKDWALKIYDWEKNILFDPSTGAVDDNLNTQTGVISNYISTYNQGTFIGSAVELYNITGDKSYLNDAIKAANYTINSLTSNRILNTEGPKDLALFKGIFIRYFTELIQCKGLDRATKDRFVLFLKFNANKLWRSGMNKNYVTCTSDWTTAPNFLSETELKAQESGCMLIEAAALLDKAGDFK